MRAGQFQISFDPPQRKIPQKHCNPLPTLAEHLMPSGIGLKIKMPRQTPKICRQDRERTVRSEQPATPCGPAERLSILEQAHRRLTQSSREDWNGYGLKLLCSQLGHLKR